MRIYFIKVDEGVFYYVAYRSPGVFFGVEPTTTASSFSLGKIMVVVVVVVVVRGGGLGVYCLQIYLVRFFEHIKDIHYLFPLKRVKIIYFD